MNNPGGGSYTLMFVNTQGNEPVTWTTDDIGTTASASTFSNRISWWFWKYYRSSISVTRTSLDDLDQETTDSSLVTKYRYNVRLLKRISGTSFDSLIATTKNTQATIDADQGPSILSSTPLGGKFRIQCTDFDGNDWTTGDIGYGHWVQGIDKVIQQKMPFLAFRTHTRELYEYDYRENGVAFAVVFEGVEGQIPECSLLDGDSAALTGESDLAMTVTTLQDYGVNRFWESIPLEMLMADAQSPGVRVVVDGLEALCVGMNCEYAYIETQGSITSQAISNKLATVQGTGLPLTGEEASLEFGGTTCIESTITSDGSTLTCTLEYYPAAGDHDEIVVGANGIVPKGLGVAPITVGLAVSSVTPSSNLNQVGGDHLVLIGDGFPITEETISITFSDGTPCNIISVTDSEVQCQVDGFDVTTIDATNGYTMTVDVNGVVDSSQTVQIEGIRLNTLSVSPSSVSPILKTWVTISLDSTFTDTMVREDFTVTLLSRDTSSDYAARSVYVHEVDDNLRTLLVKFPGAPSGEYQFKLEHATRGRLDSSALAITTESIVTSVSANSGSSLGGQLLTISGVNFSNDKYDNPVQVDGYNCYVQTTSETEITCRIDETANDSPAPTGLVIVFLSTSEEAQSAIDNAWTWATPSGTVTGMSSAFDASLNKEVVTVTGSGFTVDDLTSVSLYIDDVEQTTLTVTDTEATFSIDDMASSTSDNVKVYFSDGLPTGYDTLGSLTVTPTFTSITPSSASAGGNLFTVSGNGFGADNNLDLVHTSSGTSLCQSVDVTGYGQFTCMSV